MKPIITLIITLFIVTGVKGQTHRDSVLDTLSSSKWITDNPKLADSMYLSVSYLFTKKDTIPVLAYCLTNFDKAKFKWMHLYAIKSKLTGWVMLNGVSGAIYQDYLMPDRKTKSTYRVIFALNK